MPIAAILCDEHVFVTIGTILLQSGQFYYKVRQVLQGGTIIIKWALTTCKSFIRTLTILLPKYLFKGKNFILINLKGS